MASNRYKMVLRRVNLRPRGPRSLGRRFPHRNTTLLERELRINWNSKAISWVIWVSPRSGKLFNAPGNEREGKGGGGGMGD